MEKIKHLQKTAEQLFDLLGIKAEIGVKEEEDNLVVTINAPESTGLLIGHRGDTLKAIQSFLGIALKQATGDWTRVMVNIGDWRDKQEDYLKRLAEGAAVRAKETGESQMLYNLSADQRRVVHMILAEDKEVTTESQGEGESRYLVVKPQK